MSAMPADADPRVVVWHRLPEGWHAEDVERLLGPLGSQVEVQPAARDSERETCVRVVFGSPEAACDAARLLRQPLLARRGGPEATPRGGHQIGFDDAVPPPASPLPRPASSSRSRSHPSHSRAGLHAWGGRVSPLRQSSSPPPSPSPRRLSPPAPVVSAFHAGDSIIERTTIGASLPSSPHRSPPRDSPIRLASIRRRAAAAQRPLARAAAAALVAPVGVPAWQLPVARVAASLLACHRGTLRAVSALHSAAAETFVASATAGATAAQRAEVLLYRLEAMELAWRLEAKGAEAERVRVDLHEARDRAAILASQRLQGQQPPALQPVPLVVAPLSDREEEAAVAAAVYAVGATERQSHAGGDGQIRAAMAVKDTEIVQLREDLAEAEATLAGRADELSTSQERLAVAETALDAIAAELESARAELQKEASLRAELQQEALQRAECQRVEAEQAPATPVPSEPRDPSPSGMSSGLMEVDVSVLIEAAVGSGQWAEQTDKSGKPYYKNRCDSRTKEKSMRPKAFEKFLRQHYQPDSPTSAGAQAAAELRELEQLRAELADAKAQLADEAGKAAEASELRRELQEAREQSTADAAASAALQEELAALRDATPAADKSGDAEAELAALREELASLQKRLAEADEAVSALDETLATQKGQGRETEDALAESRRELADALQREAEREEDFDDMAAAAAAVEGLHARANELAAAAAKAEIARKDAAQRSRTLVLAQQQLESNLAAARSELQTRTEQLETARAAQEENESLTAAVQALAAESSMWKDEAASRGRVAEELAALERETERLWRSLREAEHRRDEAELRNAQAKEESSILRQRLQDARVEQEQQQQDTAAIRSTAEWLRRELEAAQQDARTQREAAIAVREENMASSGLLQNYSEKILRLEAMLNASRGETERVAAKLTARPTLASAEERAKGAAETARLGMLLQQKGEEVVELQQAAQLRELEVESLKDDARKLRSDLAEARAWVESSDSALRSEITAMAMRVEVAEAAEEEARVREAALLDARKEELLQLLSELAALQEDGRAQRRINASLERKLQLRNGKLEGLGGRLAETQGERDALDAELKAERESYRKEAEHEQRRRVAELAAVTEAATRMSQARAVRAEDEASAAQAQQSALLRRLTAAQEEAGEAEAGRRESDAEIVALREQRAQSAEQASGMSQQLEALHREVAACAEERVDLRRRFAAQKLEIDALMHDAQDARQRVAAAEARAESAVAGRTAAEKESEALRRELRKAAEALCAGVSETGDSEQRRGILRLQAAAELMRGDAAAAAEAKERLQAEVADVREHLRAEAEMRSSAETEARRLRSELEALIAAQPQLQPSDAESPPEPCARAEAAEARAAAAAAERRETEFRAECSQAQRQAAAATDAAAIAEAEREASAQRCGRLLQKLEERDAAVAAADTEIARLRGAAADTEHQQLAVSRLQARVEELVQKADSSRNSVAPVNSRTVSPAVPSAVRKLDITLPSSPSVSPQRIRAVPQRLVSPPPPRLAAARLQGAVDAPRADPVAAADDEYERLRGRGEGSAAVFSGGGREELLLHSSGHAEVAGASASWSVQLAPTAEGRACVVLTVSSPDLAPQSFTLPPDSAGAVWVPEDGSGDIRCAEPPEWLHAAVLRCRLESAEVRAAAAEVAARASRSAAPHPSDPEAIEAAFRMQFAARVDDAVLAGLAHNVADGTMRHDQALRMLRGMAPDAGRD